MQPDSQVQRFEVGRLILQYGKMYERTMIVKSIFLLETVYIWKIMWAIILLSISTSCLWENTIVILVSRNSLSRTLSIPFLAPFESIQTLRTRIPPFFRSIQLVVKCIVYFSGRNKGSHLLLINGPNALIPTLSLRCLPSYSSCQWFCTPWTFSLL